MLSPSAQECARITNTHRGAPLLHWAHHRSSGACALMRRIGRGFFFLEKANIKSTGQGDDEDENDGTMDARVRWKIGVSVLHVLRLQSLAFPPDRALAFPSA
ncbi:membrane protein [Anopheles sinensis]|uniref:Membrane protein n=1 Tax=Anopheles sinensis TaxID=74873 RepID=A0A084VFZ5_ANOSI|nr:membrane protein [Anopheles sinensis]